MIKIIKFMPKLHTAHLGTEFDIFYLWKRKK